MEFKSFRIGNIVKCKVSNDAGIYKILCLDGWNHKVMFDRTRQNEWHDVEKIKPIKLTEEWLVKLGFNKDYKKGWIGIDFGNTDFVLRTPDHEDEDDKAYRWSFSQGRVPLLKEIKYIHELQNLFNVLTQEELELK